MGGCLLIRLDRDERQGRSERELRSLIGGLQTQKNNSPATSRHIVSSLLQPIFEVRKSVGWSGERSSGECEVMMWHRMRFGD